MSDAAEGLLVVDPEIAEEIVVVVVDSCEIHVGLFGRHEFLESRADLEGAVETL